MPFPVHNFTLMYLNHIHKLIEGRSVQFPDVKIFLDQGRKLAGITVYVPVGANRLLRLAYPRFQVRAFVLVPL